MPNKLKNLTEKFIPFALPAKLVLGAVIGAIAGPGALGFASELATYRYASAQGVRLPLEGIPYLRATVTYGSFALLVISAGLFALSLYAANRIADNIIAQYRNFDQITSKGTETTLPAFRSLKFKYVVIFSFIVAVAFAAFSYGLRYFNGEKELVPATLLFSAWGFAIPLLLWRKQLSWWLAASVTLYGFIVAISLMFSVERYGEFLRYVGYGGGIEITVEQDHPADGVISIDGSLVLRTTKAFILLDSKNNEILELPMNTIRAIKHSAEPLMSLPTKLPSN